MMDRTHVLLQELMQAKGENNIEKERIIQDELAREYFANKDFRRAIEFFQNALKLIQRIGDLGEQATILSNIGEAYVAMDSPTSAIDHYKQALDIARQLGDRKLERNILGDLGVAFDKANQISLSIKAYEEALHLSHSEGKTDVSTKGPTDATVISAFDEFTLPTLNEPPVAEMKTSAALPHRLFYKSPIKRKRTRILLAMLVFALMFSTAYVLINLLPQINDTCYPSLSRFTNNACNNTINGENIGLSYGAYAFDITGRADADLKSRAAEKLRAGDVAEAKVLWHEALKADTNDAEVLIYMENQAVIDTNHAYITLVLPTMLSGDRSSITVGRGNLQGAYLAQKEYNENARRHGGVQLSLLIANIGGQSNYATLIENEILQAMHADSHIIGIMGWPETTDTTVDAINALSKAHIPIISPTGLSDILSGLSPYFFSVAPSARDQATVAANYAKHVLHAKTVAIFFDRSDTYNASLADNFKQQFNEQSNNVIVETYSEGHPDTILDLLHPVLLLSPDLIYFAGPTDDTNVLLNNLSTLKAGPSDPRPQVMGSDMLYRGTDYPKDVSGQLHFTALAYPDIWDIPAYKAHKPAFFSNYAQTFDPNNNHVRLNPYGYTLPDSNVVLAYDATFTFLTGIKNAMEAHGTNITSQQVQVALSHLNGTHAVQGVSGQISFGKDGSPINKTVTVLSVDTQGRIKIEAIVGHLLINTAP
jgi:ABC-type branched-subunit amino acid transport system substrate-binding protein